MSLARDAEGDNQRPGFGSAMTRSRSVTVLVLRARCAQGLPHKAAQSISELKRFLYFRISGVSLWGRMLVGLTFTTEILRASFSLACSCLSSSLVNRACKETHKTEKGDGLTLLSPFFWGQDDNTCFIS